MKTLTNILKKNEEGMRRREMVKIKINKTKKTNESEGMRRGNVKKTILKIYFKSKYI